MASRDRDSRNHVSDEIVHFNFTAADHCAIGNPCKNGGTCLNGKKNFECHCLPGFYGSDCGGR